MHPQECQDTKWTPQPEQDSIFITVFATWLRFWGRFRQSLRAPTKQKRVVNFLGKKCTPRQIPGYAYGFVCLTEVRRKCDWMYLRVTYAVNISGQQQLLTAETSKLEYRWRVLVWLSGSGIGDRCQTKRSMIDGLMSAAVRWTLQDVGGELWRRGPLSVGCCCQTADDFSPQFTNNNPRCLLSLHGYKTFCLDISPAEIEFDAFLALKYDSWCK